MRKPLIALVVFVCAASSYAGASPKSILKQIYEAEDHRQNDAAIFEHLDQLASQRNLAAALVALGRIGNPASVPKIARFLDDRRPMIRMTAANALGFIGGPNAVTELSKRISSEARTDVLGVLLLSLGRSGGEPELVAIESKWTLVKDNAAAFADAIEGVGQLLNKDSAKWHVSAALLRTLAELAGDGRSEIAAPAAFALTRYKGDITNIPTDVVIHSFNVASSSARALLARVLGKLKNDKALDALILGQKPADSIGIRVEIMRALANFADAPQSLEALGLALTDTNRGVRVQALQSIGAIGVKAAALHDAVQNQWLTGSLAVKSQALQTLAILAPNEARTHALSLIKEPNMSSDLVAAALSTLGALGSESDTAIIIQFMDDASAKIAEAAINAIAAVPKEKIPADVAASFRRALARRDLGITASVADAVSALEWRNLGDDLAAAYSHLHGQDDVEAKLGILGALTKIGTKDTLQLQIIEQALKDNERLVVAAAAEAYKAITQIDVSNRIPATSTVHGKLPEMRAVDRAAHAVVQLRTTRGTIRINLLGAAPVVAYRFVTLVERGFYSGLTFHRVVPNFVVQGGDPRGDGYGGPGFVIRDQVSSVRHLRGTLGMATAGKDTAGSQFFINLAPNYHLNGHYSVFGYVSSGMAVADQLEVGDTIIDAQVL